MRFTTPWIVGAFAVLSSAAVAFRPDEEWSGGWGEARGHDESGMLAHYGHEHQSHPGYESRPGSEMHWARSLEHFDKDSYAKHGLNPYDPLEYKPGLGPQDHFHFAEHHARMAEEHDEKSKDDGNKAKEHGHDPFKYHEHKAKEEENKGKHHGHKAGEHEHKAAHYHKEAHGKSGKDKEKCEHQAKDHEHKAKEHHHKAKECHDKSAEHHRKCAEHHEHKAKEHEHKGQECAHKGEHEKAKHHAAKYQSHKYNADHHHHKAKENEHRGKSHEQKANGNDEAAKQHRDRAQYYLYRAKESSYKADLWSNRAKSHRHHPADDNHGYGAPHRGSPHEPTPPTYPDKHHHYHPAGHVHTTIATPTPPPYLMARGKKPKSPPKPKHIFESFHGRFGPRAVLDEDEDYDFQDDLEDDGIGGLLARGMPNMPDWSNGWNGKQTEPHWSEHHPTGTENHGNEHDGSGKKGGWFFGW